MRFIIRQSRLVVAGPAKRHIGRNRGIHDQSAGHGDFILSVQLEQVASPVARLCRESVAFVQDDHADVVLRLPEGLHEAVEPDRRSVDDYEEFAYRILELLAAVPDRPIARSAGFRNIFPEHDRRQIRKLGDLALSVGSQGIDAADDQAMLYLSPSAQGFREVDGFAGLPAAHPVAQQPFAVVLRQPVVDRLYLMPQRPDLES